MIIGNGSLAKLLKDREGAILFASGVGNSLCENYDEYFRELMLLHEFIMNHKSLCLFYFSSIAVNFNNNNTCLAESGYYHHKELIEFLIKDMCQNYNIIRLGNIWECTNPHTFRNAIRAKQAKGEPVQIRDEWKYMIHADQLNMIVQGLPLTGKNEISVFGEMRLVKDCL
jgi:hypothetical protein